MSKFCVKLISFFIFNKSKRKLFRKLMNNENIISNIKEEIIFNISNLLSDTEDKKKLLAKHLGLIEIETFSFCNRKCWFCPNSFIDRFSQNLYMREETYLKIIRELSEINYSGNITYSRYNEPFADEIIFKRIQQARELLPNANLYTHTNGDYLTKESLKKAEKAGLNAIKIQYYLKKNENFDKTLILENMKKKLKKYSSKYTVTQLKDDYVEIKILDYKMDIIYQAINFKNFACDRAGSIDELSTNDRIHPCFIPLNNMYIDYNGSVMPCCNLRSDIKEHDKYIMGDTNKTTLWDIFASPNYVDFRRNTFVKNIKYPVCSKCNFAINYVPQNL